MYYKKIGVVFYGLFLFVILAGIISAAVTTCSIKSSCGAGETRVMGLSSLTNAHGQLVSQSGYSYSLCCDGGGSTTCDGSNKILGLSASTNAHAQVPSYNPPYTESVCYEGLECTSATALCSPSYDIPMLSLSSDTTNAHLGNFSAYSIKICCRESTIPLTPQVYWADDETQTLITQKQVVLGYTKILLVLKNGPVNTQVDFEIYEDDGLIGDDNIKIGADALKNTTDSSGNAIVTWKISQTDINNANDGGFENSPYEFFFEARSAGGLINTSGILNATILPPDFCASINYCSDYADETTCTANSCDADIIKKSGEKYNIDCTDPEKNCGCGWNSTTGKCGLYWDGEATPLANCGNNIVEPGEECDGTNLNSMTCSTFGYTEGSLSCDSSTCLFNLSACTGLGSGICGDAKINLNEDCDDGNWSIITGCTNFGFDDGDLNCGLNCHFDTGGCYNLIPDGSCAGVLAGTCSYTEDTNDNCDDGFLTYSFLADWEWNLYNVAIAGWDGAINVSGTWRCDDIASQCVGGSNTRECPAQVKLPFFGFLNLIAAVAVIILIYLALNIKKHKKKTRRKTKKK